MGLLNFFKKRAIAKKINQTSTTELNTLVQDFLKKSQKEYNNTLKTAQSLNRAALMDKSTRKLKEEMRDIIDDEEEEPEEEESDKAEEMLLTLAQKFLTHNAGASGLETTLDKMSQEEKAALVAKFLK